VLICLTALAFRLNAIGFGLPALYDPDEPFFIITALKLLKHGTLNPGWFGHPGTTTLYTLALIEMAALGVGLASGRFASIQAFAAAVPIDPGIVVLPGRLFFVACALVCVLLTWAIGRRAFGERVGLAAAALLAVNAVHIAWSQVIRTDVQATMFMLASVWFAMRAGEDGRMKNFLLAGALAGVACATKWPAATVIAAPIGAALWRWRTDHQGKAAARACALTIAAALAGTFLASPYLLLDFHTVIADVSGEVRSQHLGATGGSPLYDLGWYALGPVRGSMGWVGLIAIPFGALLMARHPNPARIAVLAAAVAFLIAICSQRLVWDRWLLPAIPFLTIFVAVAIDTLARAARRRSRAAREGWTFATLFVLVLVPSCLAARAQSIERRHDTRALASAWAIGRFPFGSRVLVEHPAMNLIRQPWHFLFPLGREGCVDAMHLLRSEGVVSDVQKSRGESPVVDIGTVSPERLSTCRADYAILTNYDRYLAEPGRFPREVTSYRRLLSRMRIVAVFRPSPGAIGGPVVRIAAACHPASMENLCTQ